MVTMTERDRPSSPPRSRRAAALPPEERRRAIVEAAGPLVARHGRQVTTRQIAEAAGVAEGTLFRVFDDKDEIILATAEALLDPERLEEALGGIDRTGPIDAQLAEAIAVIEARTSGIFQMMGQLGPDLRARLARPMVDSDALIALLIPFADRLRTEPRRAARHLRAIVLALTHPMLAGEPASVDEIVDLFANGVLRPETDRPGTDQPRTDQPGSERSGATAR